MIAYMVVYDSKCRNIYIYICNLMVLYDEVYDSIMIGLC